MDSEKLKYPIGRHVRPENITPEMIAQYIRDIESFPARLRKAIENCSEADFDRAYRPGGWTVRQVIHHCADSHMNSVMRFKLALTEDKPVIKPYFEDRWGELPDTREGDVETAMKLLEGLHGKWAHLLHNMSPADFERRFVHPEQGREIRLDETAAMYAWHCNHHLAHVELALKGH